MECETVARTYNHGVYRKVQTSLMCVCVLCYVMVNVYIIWFNGKGGIVSMLQQCESNYSEFAEEFLQAESSREDTLRTGCPCSRKTCVPKCCPLNQSMYSPASGMTCVSSSNLAPFSDQIAANLQIYYNSLTNDTTALRSKKVFPADVYTIADKPVCKIGADYWITDDKQFLLEDGMVLTGYYENATFIPTSLLDLDEYCVELADDKLQIFTSDRCIEKNPIALSLYSVFETYYIYYVEKCMACLCIMIMISTHLYLPELRTFHGKKLVCFLACLGVEFFSHSLVQIYTPYNYRILVLSVVVSAISEASKCLWLTSMSFGLWSVFSRPLQTVRKRSKENLKLTTFGFFSLALPSLSYIYYVLYKEEIAESPACKGLFRKANPCTAMNSRMYYIMYQLPIFLLASLNVVMFLSTLVNLRLHSRRSSWLTDADSRRHSQAAKEGLWTYVKLSLVMGLPYALNVFCFMVIHDEGLSLVGMIRARLINVCPTVLAVVLLGNRRVLKLLRKKLARCGLPCLRTHSALGARSTAVQLSDS